MSAKQAKDYTDINGILAVDKPEGPTSHDIVDFVRRKFRIKKVGHAGTLDPMATGLLILLLGSSTKLSGRFSGDDKEYVGMMTLGARTDTGDRYGKVICRNGSRSDIDRSTIEKTIMEFTGFIEQVPPAYSALKHKGEPLYKYARKGIEIKKESRKKEKKRFDILDYSYPDLRFKVFCSKGTYVRKLCDDIGERLGCGGHLSGLRRTRSGRVAIDGAVRFDVLKDIGIELLRAYIHDDYAY